jgi:histidyl-tRNA synthetase
MDGMDKTKLQPLKGFRDFLPEKMTIRNKVIKRLRGVFEKYGFDEAQTPALEYQEVLLGKYGEEAEKLMYLFKDQGKRNVGLRYDLTVPLARLMASSRNLPTPFKRYQIQPVWRAEKPQKGRYREIYQCDVDIVGSSSPLADAEILAVTNDSLSALGFTSFIIKINSRKVLFESMKKAKIPKQQWLATIQSIDKLNKKSRAKVKKELSKKGLLKKQVENVFKTIESAKPDNFLKQVINYAEKLGVGKNLVFDPTLARGLDYYTGPIFESQVDKPKIGSITGGGRYDELLKDLGGPDLPATGTSIGLDRAADAIDELGLWKDVPRTTTKVLVTIFSPDFIDRSVEAVSLLRKANINTELYPDAKAKLNKQLKYADGKGLEWVVIIGPNETLKNSVTLKNLKTKTQETIPVQALLTKIE